MGGGGYALLRLANEKILVSDWLIYNPPTYSEFKNCAHLISAMNKNGLMIEKENRKLIESESMVLNQVFFASKRTCAKILKSLTTDHTSTALQTRIAFTERKNAWIDQKADQAKLKFFDYLGNDELRNPSFVEESLDELRECQSRFISQRTDLLLGLSDIQSMNMEPENIDSIISSFLKIENELENCLRNAFETIQNRFEMIWEEMEAEEAAFLALVGRYTTDESFQAIEESAKMSSYEIMEEHRRQIYDLDVIFEDLSRNGG